MNPLNDRWEEAVRQAFGRQTFMATLGASLARLAPGEIEVELPFRTDLLQQSGTLHAGVIAAIADTACGFAAFSLMPEGSNVLSVEFKLNLLAPAFSERLLARARVIRAGNTITSTACDVFAGEALVATMSATMIRR